MPAKIEVTGLEPLRRNLSATPHELATETRKVMTASLLLLEAEIKTNAPRDTGRLQGSVSHTITGTGFELTGRVGPSAKYGLFVEKGTRAHYPPIAAISGWARRHGIHPFLVARAISRRGTRAHPFVEPALGKHKGTITRLFQQIGKRVATNIVGGR